MKKLFSIITVIFLFIISGVILWAGLSPKTFPWGYTKISEVGVISTKGGKLSIATSSEPVTSSKGEVRINGNTWNVEIAAYDTSQEKGLSNRKTLYSKNGMLFVFEKSANQQFWMKDMIIPIDMIFFDDNWKIVLIEKDISPQTFPKTFGGGVKSKYVMEINAGEAETFGLKVGDQAIFLNK